VIESKLSDSSAGKNLTYGSPGSQLVYISIPKYSNVLEAEFDLGGYQHSGEYPSNILIDTGDDGTADYSYPITLGLVTTKWVYQEDLDQVSCHGEWFDGTESTCPNIYDGDWDTYGSAYPAGTACKIAYALINYTKPSMTWHLLSDSTKWQVKYGTSWFLNATISPGCLEQEVVQFKVTSYYMCGSSIPQRALWECYDGTGWYTLSSTSSTTGAGYNIYEESVWWAFDSDSGTQRVDLDPDAIEGYLSSCSPDIEGYCDVPIRLSSDSAGILEISDIYLKYNYHSTPLEESMSTASVYEFSDSSTSKTLQFPYGGGEETHYVKLPRESTVKGARINATGYLLNDFSSSSLVIDGTHQTMYGQHFFDSVEIVNGGVLNVAPHNGTTGTGTLVLNVDKHVLVDSSSSINGNWKGYEGFPNIVDCSSNDGAGPGHGDGSHGCAYGGGGAGYGGTGQNGGGTEGGAGGIEYGSTSNPDYLMGSGGGSGTACGYAGVTNCGKGGNGGAGIYLEADSVIVSGAVTSDGENGYTCDGAGGGGSGGTITIKSRMLDLSSSVISADGGDMGTYAGSVCTRRNYGGGGAGGRIKLFYDSLLNYSADVSSEGGLSGGGVGTIYYERQPSYPTDLNLFVGNSQDKGWNFADPVFEIDTSVIQDYLDSCVPDQEGFCDVPLKFVAGTGGEVEIHGLEIEYAYQAALDFSPEINSFLQTCTPGFNGICQVPFDFSADSDGSLEVYDLRIFYRERNSPPAIDSFSPAGDPIINEGDSIIFSISKSDPNYDPLEVAWYLNGEIAGNGDSYAYQSDYKSSGAHKINVIVSDGTDTASYEWDLTVNDVTANEVYIDPYKRKTAVGIEFFMDVRINAIEEVYTSSFDLEYDTEKLSVISVEEGDFLNGDSSSTYMVVDIDNDLGRVSFADTRTGTQTGISGDGRVARLNFKAENAGVAELKLDNIKISGTSLDLLAHFNNDGMADIYPLAGDVNYDLIVDILDLAMVGMAFGTIPGDPDWNGDADLNGDGVVNIYDLATVGANHGKETEGERPDRQPPVIAISSPLNMTYETTEISFNVSTNESVLWCVYSLNGEANATMDNSSATEWMKADSNVTDNMTHDVIFYCMDVAGNLGESSKVYFSVRVPHQNLNHFDDFETGWGNWTNEVTGDTDNWYIGSSTPSSSTGPTVGANGTAYFAYVETSSSWCYYAGENAILWMSPDINFNAHTGENIDFYYHMYGTSIGTLRLQENSTGTWIDVWSATGQQSSSQTDWMQTGVDLSSIRGTGHLRFNYECHGGFTGDASVDQISVTGY